MRLFENIIIALVSILTTKRSLAIYTLLRNYYTTKKQNIFLKLTMKACTIIEYILNSTIARLILLQTMSTYRSSQEKLFCKWLISKNFAKLTR